MSYADTKLLLPCGGLTGSTDFRDYGLHNRGIYRYESGITMSADQVNHYAAAFDHDGTSGSHLEIFGMTFSSGDTLVRKGAADFAVQFNFRPAADGTEIFVLSHGRPGSGTGVISHYRQGVIISRDPDNTINIRAGNLSRDGTGGFYHHRSTSTVTAGSWTHVRIVVSSNAVALSLNGTPDTLVNANGSYQTTLANCALHLPTPMNIGGTNWAANGNAASASTTQTSAAFFMDDLQIVIGSALPTTFTPPGKLITTLSNASGPALLDGNGSAASRSIVFFPRILDAANSRAFPTDSDGSGDFSVDVPASTEFSDIDNYSAVAIGEGSETDQLVTDIADDTDDIAIAFGYPNTAFVTLTGFPASASGIAVDVSVDRDSAPFYSATGQSANGSGELAIAATGCPLATGTRTVWIRCTNSDGLAGGVSNNSRAFYAPVSVTVS